MRKNQSKTKEKKLTKRQRQIIDFLKNTIRKRGYPPSIREICDATSLSSSSTVHNHLCNLEKKGYIKREASKPRSIEVVKIKNKISNKPLEEKFNHNSIFHLYEKDKVTDILSKTLYDTEENTILPLIAENNDFSSFGVNKGDILLVKEVKKSTDQSPVITIKQNGEISMGYNENVTEKNNTFLKVIFFIKQIEKLAD